MTNFSYFVNAQNRTSAQYDVSADVTLFINETVNNNAVTWRQCSIKLLRIKRVRRKSARHFQRRNG